MLAAVAIVVTALAAIACVVLLWAYESAYTAIAAQQNRRTAADIAAGPAAPSGDIGG